MATAVAADPAMVVRKGEAASAVLELEEDAARCQNYCQCPFQVQLSHLGVVITLQTIAVGPWDDLSSYL